jgi:hypothetical protein
VILAFFFFNQTYGKKKRTKRTEKRDENSKSGAGIYLSKIGGQVSKQPNGPFSPSQRHRLIQKS